ncbi:MAG: DUF402 domain-containing protein [Bacilli bacterium]|nr:DUF402 domain-containing protein [Bacilli bacterium]
MNNINVGDNLTIHCYKHNGILHRVCEEATVLEITEEKIVCANDKTKIIENDGRSYHTNELAILIFYKKNWFNIIAQLKEQGLFYYCNIASPYIIDNKIIKYIDYDLDLRVFPDGGFRILDRNEYKYHKRIMKYSNDLDLIIKEELQTLIELKKDEKEPFQKEIIDKYYQKYVNLKKNAKN